MGDASHLFNFYTLPQSLCTSHHQELDLEDGEYRKKHQEEAEGACRYDSQCHYTSLH